MVALRMPRLKKCCCCLPLRIGSLLIGYGSIIFSLLSISATSLSLYRVIVFVQNHENEPVPGHTPEDMGRVAQSLYISHAYLLLVYLYYLIISLFLIVGIHM
ncbi:jg8083, partial [Pararge aegeria aegeria]